MTVEDMIARWPQCPPFDAQFITIISGGNTQEISFDIDQNSIKEIREYLDAVEECMNG